MNFKTFTGAIALAATLALSASAQAATVLSWTNGNVGVTKSLDFDGKVGNALVNGLAANIDFKLASVTNGGKTWTFSYDVDNTSKSPVTSSTITNFGFNVDPNVSGASIGGQYTKASLSGNVPGLGSFRDVCFGTSNGQNCASNSSSGVDFNDADGTGTFSLTFSSSKTSLSLSDFYVRYNDVDAGRSYNGATAYGTGFTPVTSPAGGVPEPATWAMMLIGFFAIGSTLRTRRLALA